MNMPYKYMSDLNTMNNPYQYNNAMNGPYNNAASGPYQYNKVMELEQRVGRLEREMRRIEHKIMTANKQSQQPLISKTEKDIENNDGMYML